MVPGIALVQRGRGQLPAAMIAQDPLLLGGRQRRIGHGHVEPAGAVARVRPGAVVGRERDEGPHERRRGNHVEPRVRNGGEPALLHEGARPLHLARVRPDERRSVQMVGTQPLHHVAPVLPVAQPRRALRQVRFHLLAEVQAVAPQLRRRVTQRVLVVQPEVERLFAQREPVGGRLEPPLEIVLEVRQRGAGPLRRHPQPLRLPRPRHRQRRRDLLDEQQAARRHAERRLDEEPHRLDERRPRVVQQLRHVLQSPRQRAHPLRGRAVVPQQQEVQAAQQVREPECRVLGLRALALEAGERHPTVVQQRRAVDLVVETLSGGSFQGGADRLEGGEVGAERVGAESPEAVVVVRQPRLGGRHRIEMPP